MNSLIMFFAASALFASPIALTFGSQPSSQNTSGHSVTGQMIAPTMGPQVATVEIGQNPAWASPFPGSQWIGIAQTGDPSRPGWVQYQNGTSVRFTDTFVLPHHFVVQSAILSVMADDSGNGWVNGAQVYSVSHVPSPHCAGMPPGCLESTQFRMDITRLVHGGNNVFVTNIIQQGLSSFGVNWTIVVKGEVCDPMSPVPEPQTASLILGGGFFIGLYLLRRKRN